MMSTITATTWIWMNVSANILFAHYNRLFKNSGVAAPRRKHPLNIIIYSFSQNFARTVYSHERRSSSKFSVPTPRYFLEYGNGLQQNKFALGDGGAAMQTSTQIHEWTSRKHIGSVGHILTAARPRHHPPFVHQQLAPHSITYLTLWQAAAVACCWPPTHDPPFAQSLCAW